MAFLDGDSARLHPVCPGRGDCGQTDTGLFCTAGDRRPRTALTADIERFMQLARDGATDDLAGALGESDLFVNDIVDDRGRGLLHAAAEEGRGQTVLRLVKLGADLAAVDGNGQTFAHYAAARGYMGVITAAHPEKLMTAVDDRGRTVMHLAAAGNHVDMLEHLQRCGASVHAQDRDGKAPLHIAAENGFARAVRKLRRLGARIDASTGPGHGYIAPIHFAAASGDLETIREFLAFKCDVNVRDYWDAAPLHYAARAGKSAALSLLHEHGADVRAVDHWGQTAAHMAAAEGHAGLLRLLKRLGADIGAPAGACWVGYGLDPYPIRGQTPLHWAVYHGRVSAAQALIELGAEIGARDGFDQTPLDLASRAGEKGAELRKLLLRCEADGKALA